MVDHERKEETANLDATLQRFGVEYAGTGPSVLQEEHDEVNPDAVDSPQPLSGLGFGWEAYWRMLYSMSGIFLVLTVLFIPQMGMLQGAAGLKGLPNYANSEWSLGNFGYSQATCISQYTRITESRQIGCDVGVMHFENVGILPNVDEN